MINYTAWNDSMLHDYYPLYPYQPNTTIPIIVAGIFAVATVYHIVIASMRGAWGYWWMFILGLVIETLGYVCRHFSAIHDIGTKNVGWYAGALIPVVVAPAFLAASLYSSYGHLIRYVSPEHSPIKRVTLIFVFSDLGSIFVQSSGSSMISSTDASKQKLGRKVLILGFLIQLVAFSAFLIVSIIFYRRVKRDNIPLRPWNKMIFGLWSACILILVRSVYRTMEFVTGQQKDGDTTGYILTHEWVLWVFDALLVILATSILSIIHPSFYLPRDKTETLQVLPTKQEMFQQPAYQPQQPQQQAGWAPPAQQWGRPQQQPQRQQQGGWKPPY